MEKTVYFNQLYLIYGSLLTENEKELFNLYYAENLSMQEIAENKKISRSAVGNTIKTAEKKLESYEQKIQYLAKQQAILNLVKSTDYYEEILELFTKGE